MKWIQLTQGTRVSAKGVRYYLGTFPTAQAAYAAYKKAARKLQGEYSGV